MQQDRKDHLEFNSSFGCVIPRAVPEGIVPLIAVEGTAFECGQNYAELVIQKYAGYRKYLDKVEGFFTSGDTKRLFEQRAPYVPDIYNGMLSVVGSNQQTTEAEEKSGCTCFGVSGSITLDGEPISGQNKDPGLDRVFKYIVLRMRIKNGPTILVLAYPGEVLGYGMWSTGMSLFRSDLYSTAESDRGLEFEYWGLLALAGQSVDESAETAKKYGLRGCGSYLISDGAGKSISIESNIGGISIIPSRDGIATHANHPVGENTAPFEAYPNKIEAENSRYRMNGLWELLNTERGRLTAQKSLMCLSDHAKYPRGICRHIIGDSKDMCTTASVIAEPTKGKLHVVRGNPCSNWPTTYTI